MWKHRLTNGNGSQTYLQQLSHTTSDAPSPHPAAAAPLLRAHAGPVDGPAIFADCTNWCAACCWEAGHGKGRVHCAQVSHHALMCLEHATAAGTGALCTVRPPTIAALTARPAAHPCRSQVAVASHTFKANNCSNCEFGAWHPAHGPLQLCRCPMLTVRA